MNRFMFSFSLLLVSLVVGPMPAFADQYAYNSRAICVEAVKQLPVGAIVISYCSLCDGERVEIWRVQQAFVSFTGVEDCYEVTIFAKKLYQSKPFDSGGYQEPVEYERLKEGEASLAVTGVDLAYIYVTRPGGKFGKFRVLAKELKLKPFDCRVNVIRLPKPLIEELCQPKHKQAHFPSSEVPDSPTKTPCTATHSASLVPSQLQSQGIYCGAATRACDGPPAN
ncbi:MAG: hypothetical protein WCH99_06530 [Verrucomicrobiota bacterium]